MEKEIKRFWLINFDWKDKISVFIKPIKAVSVWWIAQAVTSSYDNSAVSLEHERIVTVPLSISFFILEAKNNDYSEDLIANTIILYTTVFKDQVNLIITGG